MPIYGYQCDDCGHRYDRLQKLSEDDPTQCPVCQSAALRRQMSAPSFRLAGSGWYETDFKKDGDSKRNLVDSGTSEGGGSTDGGGGESKSEGKTESKSESKAESKPKSEGKSEGKSESKAESKPVAAPTKTESKPAATPPASSGN